MTGPAGMDPKQFKYDMPLNDATCAVFDRVRQPIEVVVGPHMLRGFWFDAANNLSFAWWDELVRR